MREGAFGRSDAEIDLLVRGMRSGIAVVGFGYIGTVIGAVLADRGWPVTGIDVRQSVVDEINLGKTTVAEPGLSELVANNVRVGRLRATTDFGAIADNDFVIVNVGTPLGPDYEPIVDDITAAARALGEHLQPGHVVILKSTVPPDTTETLVRPILEETSGLRAGVDFGLAFCPERLAEGQAIHELTSIPVVVGAVDERSARACATLWRHALGSGLRHRRGSADRRDGQACGQPLGGPQRRAGQRAGQGVRPARDGRPSSHRGRQHDAEGRPPGRTSCGRVWASAATA